MKAFDAIVVGGRADAERDDLPQEPARAAVAARQFQQVGRREDDLSAHVERDERDRHAALEHPAGRHRVAGEMKLGHRRRVTRLVPGATEADEPFH